MCDACRHLIALTFDGGLKIYQANCKQWECIDCRPFMARKLRGKIMSGLPDKMLTLTSQTGLGDSRIERRKLMGVAFNVFIKRIKREFNLKALPFFVVVEETERGEPHFHVLLRAPFLRQAWLSAQWEELTGARIVDIRAVRDPKNATYYVSKYLSKKPARFGSTKRFWHSRDWKIASDEPVEPRKVFSEPKLLKHLSLVAYREALIGDGWQITSQQSTSLEARHPDGARAPPLSECMVDMQALYPRRHAKQETA
jgi:hypothetical protein